MTLLLNIIFAILAFMAARYLLGLAKINDPINVIISTLVAILIFMLDIAAQL